MPYGPALFPPDAARTHTSGQPGPLGYNVLHSMSWQAEHGMDLSVHKGTTRCLTWVGDTVRGLVMVLGSGQEGTWNVNRNDDHVEVRELAERVVALTGSKSRVVEVDVPERVTLRKSLVNDRLLELGWAPTVNLDKGIRACHDYYRNFDKDGRWAG
jgi:nucleoside-diphosphate-sugar epimerase